MDWESINSVTAASAALDRLFELIKPVAGQQVQVSVEFICRIWMRIGGESCEARVKEISFA